MSHSKAAGAGAGAGSGETKESKSDSSRKRRRSAPDETSKEPLEEPLAKRHKGKLSPKADRRCINCENGTYVVNFPFSRIDVCAQCIENYSHGAHTGADCDACRLFGDYREATIEVRTLPNDPDLPVPKKDELLLRLCHFHLGKEKTRDLGAVDCAACPLEEDILRFRSRSQTKGACARCAHAPGPLMSISPSLEGFGSFVLLCRECLKAALKVFDAGVTSEDRVALREAAAKRARAQGVGDKREPVFKGAAAKAAAAMDPAELKRRKTRRERFSGPDAEPPALESAALPLQGSNRLVEKQPSPPRETLAENVFRPEFLDSAAAEHRASSPPAIDESKSVGAICSVRNGKDGTNFELFRNKVVTIGSGNTSSIRVQEPCVAAVHGELKVNNNGQVVWTAVGTGSPSLVNGAFVFSGGSVILKHDDTIEVANRRFRLCLRAEAAAPRAGAGEASSQGAGPREPSERSVVVKAAVEAAAAAEAERTKAYKAGFEAGQERSVAESLARELDKWPG